MPDTDETSASAELATRRTTRRFLVVAISVAAVLVSGLVAVVWWAQSRQTEGASVVRDNGFAAYEPAWTSAMAKAGVEATFPAGPVELTSLRASGQRRFSATFSADEIEALLVVYPFAPTTLPQDVDLRDLEIAFPEPRVSELRARVGVGGAAYSVHAIAPTTYANDTIVIGSTQAKLTVEGFGVDGERKSQALRTFADYLNALLDSAPGLSVDSAEITAEGLAVEGAAPQRIEHPDGGESAP